VSRPTLAGQIALNPGLPRLTVLMRVLS